MDDRFDVVNPAYTPTQFWRAFMHCHAVQKVFVWTFKRLFGMRVYNTELVPLQNPYIVVANHGSHYDLFLALAAVYDIAGQMPVAAVWDGAFNVPIFGNIIKAVPCIAVDTRPEQEDARMHAVREMAAHLRAGRTLIIGSEGERRDTLGRFEGGAAFLSMLTRVKVVPVSLRGVQELFRDLSWPDRYRGKVEMILHAPLDPATFEAAGGSRREIMARFTQAIRDQVAADVDYPVGAATAEPLSQGSR